MARTGLIAFYPASGLFYHHTARLGHVVNYYDLNGYTMTEDLAVSLALAQAIKALSLKRLVYLLSHFNSKELSPHFTLSLLIRVAHGLSDLFFWISVFNCVIFDASDASTLTTGHGRVGSSSRQVDLRERRLSPKLMGLLIVVLYTAAPFHASNISDAIADGAFGALSYPNIEQILKRSLPFFPPPTIHSGEHILCMVPKGLILASEA
ncbi:uncharacterized protein LACBIDRAFT_327494 [Laccaria bicolor S238N-H82]|uniref:Predicted protein n=1 Tax=Laccaria bicolor (strain S238N-H82 / ATCC MYA-4686) TaxID=486041 RepID=B0DBW5_LACBS|nr:uncharacterized protein LACBIDRAFT_327494 [Laccaria bicolor S238N-H82]EDR07789.1 predicted protein [Laccaria bicolor S238N-H82]|eukprot:XP_001881578.1 predicted protein [Laccaria bicolor S238N-H82]